MRVVWQLRGGSSIKNFIPDANVVGQFEGRWLLLVGAAACR